MKFVINGNTWTIKEMSRYEFESTEPGTLAETCYIPQEIHLSNDSKAKKADLVHELCHVWLYEYGHMQNEKCKFHFEQVCQIVACSNDFINSVVELYFKEKK